MRPRISIRGCVRPLVRRNAFVKIAENGVMQDEDASYVVYTALLDASSHLHKRVCPSVGPLVHLSVGPSVRPSVGNAIEKTL